MSRTVFTSNEALNVASYISTVKPLWETAFPSINKRVLGLGMQRGIPRGDHTVVGAGSHVGKTIFGLSEAFQAAASGEIAAVFSLEMETLDLCQRMLQGHSEIPVGEWRPDRWTERHTEQLVKDAGTVARELGAAGIAVYGDEHFHGDLDNLDTLFAAMEEAVDDGVTWLLIDNAQLIDVPGADEYNATKIVNKEVRKFARRLGVTTVLLSQLKRAAAEDMTRSPRITDLLGGTSIESNADHIILLDHSLRDRTQKDEAKWRMWIELAKNRRGPSGIRIPVEVDYSTLHWREARPDEEMLWPTRDT